MSGFPRQRYPFDPTEHSFVNANMSHPPLHNSHHELPPHEHNNAQFQQNQSKSNFPLGANPALEHVDTMSSYPCVPIDYAAEHSFVSAAISQIPTHKQHQELLPHENNNAHFQSQQKKNNFPMGVTSTPEQESFVPRHIHNPQQYFPSAIDHPNAIEAHPIPSAPPPMPPHNPNYLNVDLSKPPYPPRQHNANHDKSPANRYVSSTSLCIRPLFVVNCISSSPAPYFPFFLTKNC